MKDLVSRKYVLTLISLLYFSQLFSQQAMLLEAAYVQLDGFYVKEDFRSCLKLERDLLISTRNRTDTLVAEVYFLLGDSHLQTGNTAKAIDYFEKELVIRRKLNLTQTEAFSNGLYNLTAIYRDEGDYGKAKKTGQELLELDASLKGIDSEAYLASVQFVLDVLERSGDLLKAKELGEKTLKEVEKNNPAYPLLLSKMADIYSQLGYYSKSESSFLEAIPQLKQTDEISLNAVNSSINLASLYINQGRYPEAEELLTNSCAILKGMKDENATESYMSALNSLAIVQEALARYEEAEVNLREVREYDREKYGEKHPYFAATLSNMGNLYVDMGRFPQAEQLLLNALDILKNDSENRLSYGIKQNNLGNAYRHEGDIAKAVPLYQNALSIFKEKTGEGALYATATFNLGQAYYQASDPKAKAELSKALALREKLFGKNHPAYGEVTRKLAALSWSKKDYVAAEGYFKKTFDNYFAQIDNYFPALSEEEKSKFYFGKLKLTFEEFYSYAIEQHVKKPTLLGDVYDYQLRTKALTMYATLKVRQSILNSKNEELINQYRQWINLKEQLAKLHNQTSENPIQAQVKIDSINTAANILEKYLSVKSELFNKTFKTNPVSWKDIQRKLKPGEAATECIRFRSFSPDEGGGFVGKIVYAFLVVTKDTKNNPTLVMLPNAGRIEDRFLSYYRNTIRHEMNDSISYNQYWSFLKPALKGVQKVYFSPDGVYNQINLNTLQNPKTRKTVLEEIFIQPVTNTKDILLLQQASNKKGKAYLLGFPIYATPTKKEKDSKPATGNQRGLRSGLLRYMRGDDGIPLLPATKTEVDEIGKLFPADQPIQSVTENQATESFIKGVESPKSLHIATHGFFLEDLDFSNESNFQKYIENPLLRSGLILAGAGDFITNGIGTDGNEDGILTAYEVMNLNLDQTDLVVLSACETGLGTVKNGEGVYGLQRSFQIAGAKSIIMSLWSVDDEATKDLMILFYKAWLTSENKHEAFRIAQTQLKQKYPNPFYWGAFVMIGE
ncbi:MAG: CHAT domain-containing protein [Cytophagales bacterium]|nr:CHAT domain-containing protein [Cytophagales bacterium]MCA6365482.1 CHAT domain-containing protein [Cytophagales bacterium]MCA6370348.1 CHAT domain-containing protein [Cytophagales bacterium]MCA6376472.1 CHAT domain-containing protein [Cytophagales bacterium]MCA6385489.1 CHAT domain-containing protein [Cytophagales bacterium]